MTPKAGFKVTVKLPPDLRDWLRKQAEAQNRSMHGQIIALLSAAKAAT